MAPADEDAPAAPRPPARLRWAWLALGHGSVGLGALGAVLPLLPTTPFLLLAAWAYARSSPELRARLYRHPRYGAALRAWHEQGAIAPRAKALAVGLLLLSWTLAVWTTSHPATPWIMGGVVLAVASFLLTRPSPRG